MMYHNICSYMNMMILGSGFIWYISMNMHWEFTGCADLLRRFFMLRQCAVVGISKLDLIYVIGKFIIPES